MRLIAVLAGTFFFTSIFGQSSRLGNWLIGFGNQQLNAKWNYHYEAQYRNYDAFGDMEQLLLRTGFGYNLTEGNNNILLGYGFIRSANYNGSGGQNIFNEHRIFQQFITRQRFGRTALQHRYRMEERFFSELNRFRFRYFLGINVALNRSAMEASTFYWSCYNEIFIQPHRTVFDRNRLYSGLGYMVDKHYRFELGYMNQFFERGGRDQLNIIGFLSF
ncbi:MAG: DUF2490 domain-containing protein [Flavobacteriales bacterium]|nr:DUF2490 domain-containing protein [Flavobacteriales bacterium]